MLAAVSTRPAVQHRTVSTLPAVQYRTVSTLPAVQYRTVSNLPAAPGRVLPTGRARTTVRASRWAVRLRCAERSTYRVLSSESTPLVPLSRFSSRVLFA
jgi:hypothetical protein